MKTIKLILYSIIFSFLFLFFSNSSFAQTINLISNPSAETVNPSDTSSPLDWQKLRYGTNATTFSYVDGDAHDGSRSLLINMTSRTSGDAKWYFKEVNVSPNTQYYFSNYYKSSVTTELMVNVINTDGAISYIWLKSIPASANWTKSEITYTTPANASKIFFYQIIKRVGFLQTDNYDLHPFSEIPVIAPSITPTITPPTDTTKFTRPLLTLTFDDGIKSQINNGIPLLNKYLMKATFYILSGKLDGNWYMNPQDVINLSRDGHHIASHTIDHPDLTKLSTSALDRQLSKSQTDLQNLIGLPVKDFSTPYGRYNSSVLSQIKKYYTSHRTVKIGYNTKSGFDQYQLKVQNILNTTRSSEIQSWIQQAKNNNSWLILAYHSVTSNPDKYSTTTPEFDRHLNAIKNSNISVVTLDQALTELLPQL